jgi:Tol biopolymer transport system component
LVPRFGGSSLFYLSSQGSGDGLWRFQNTAFGVSRNGQAVEIWKGVEGGLLLPPAISTDGRRVVFALRRQGKLRLHLLSADGTDLHPMTETIDIRGAGSWSPDGKWIIIGGQDAKGPGLFKIPSDGGTPVRLLSASALNPVCSPNGELIVYNGPSVGPKSPLLAIHSNGAPFEMPDIRVRVQGERFRFLPDGKGLVYMEGSSPSQDFWLLDLSTKKKRQLTRFSSAAAMRTFDITPDGTQIVFDRLQENSDIVLIDLQRQAAQTTPR